MSWAAVAVVGVAAVAGTSAYLASEAEEEGREDATKKTENFGFAEEVSTRGINLRRYEAFPRILETHRDFDKQFFAQKAAQVERADSFRRRVTEEDIIPGIMRDREQMFAGDVKQFNQQLNQQGGAFREGLLNMSPELRSAGYGVQAQDALLAKLYGQAQDDLDRGGNLSAEGNRAVEQGTASAVGQRGRGAGAFGVGQLALNRESARQGREDRSRQFAGQVFGMGGESQRRNLLQASQFTSPFLNMLSQSQAANRQAAGTPSQAFTQNAQFAAHATPDVPVFDPNVMNLEQMRLGIATNNANAAIQGGVNRGQYIEGAGAAISSAFTGGMSGPIAGYGSAAAGSGGNSAAFSDPSTGGVMGPTGQPLMQGPANANWGGYQGGASVLV